MCSRSEGAVLSSEPWRLTLTPMPCFLPAITYLLPPGFLGRVWAAEAGTMGYLGLPNSC